HELTLCPVGEVAAAVIRTPPSAVQAGRADAVQAIDAGHVAVVEGRDDKVADGDSFDVVAYRLDNADEFVADAVRLFRRDHTAIGPEVGSTDTRRDDANDGVAAGA